LTISNLYALNLDAKFGHERLEFLKKEIEKIPPKSLILCSELAFSGYHDLGEEFAAGLISEIRPNLGNKTIAFTREIHGFNEFLMFDKSGIIYRQNKAILFAPNRENELFYAGETNEIRTFSHENIKFGVLICFEIRFTELWQQLNGADVILVPAMWRKAKSDDFITLCKALALQNRAYVVACSDGGKNELKFHGVFLPNGICKEFAEFERNEIVSFKRNLGLFNE